MGEVDKRLFGSLGILFLDIVADSFHQPEEATAGDEEKSGDDEERDSHVLSRLSKL
jgi:hypothetical protein